MHRFRSADIKNKETNDKTLKHMKEPRAKILLYSANHHFQIISHEYYHMVKSLNKMTLSLPERLSMEHFFK